MPTVWSGPESSHPVWGLAGRLLDEEHNRRMGGGPIGPSFSVAAVSALVSGSLGDTEWAELRGVFSTRETCESLVFDVDSTARVVEVGETGGRDDRAGSCAKTGSVRGHSSYVGGSKKHVVGVATDQVGGPNLERNRENRRLKRERKLKRQSMNQDWRKRDKSTVDSGVSVGGNQGFWNSCSPEVRQQLIDSKAEWHIAENKRRAREEVAKLEKSTSVQAVVKQVLDTVKLANELKKNTKDEKIGGWAETVADSLNKSVAESVPSSLPSLESVGYGEAAIGRGGLSTPQTSNSEYDEVCQKLADKESICEKLNLRISELETKQLVSDGEMKKVLENEKNVEKRLFEAEIDKIKLRHYSSDIFCDDFLQRDIDMFTRDYKKKQQQKKKNKGS